MSKFLDASGLTRLWNRIKTYAYSKTQVDEKLGNFNNEGTIKVLSTSTSSLVINTYQGFAVVSHGGGGRSEWSIFNKTDATLWVWKTYFLSSTQAEVASLSPNGLKFYKNEGVYFIVWGVAS